MKTTYDKEIDAKYITVRSGAVAETKRQQDWLLFDYDTGGHMVGIEILDASLHPLEVSVLSDSSVHIVELDNLLVHQG